MAFCVINQQAIDPFVKKLNFHSLDFFFSNFGTGKFYIAVKERINNRTSHFFSHRYGFFSCHRISFIFPFIIPKQFSIYESTLQNESNSLWNKTMNYIIHFSIPNITWNVGGTKKLIDSGSFLKSPSCNLKIVSSKIWK